MSEGRDTALRRSLRLAGRLGLADLPADSTNRQHHSRKAADNPESVCISNERGGGAVLGAIAPEPPHRTCRALAPALELHSLPCVPLLRVLFIVATFISESFPAVGNGGGAERSLVQAPSVRVDSHP